MRSFEEIARQFLSSNYTFVRFEFDELRGSECTIRYVHNLSDIKVPKQTGFEYLDKTGLGDWHPVWPKTYLHLYEEFKWFMWRKYPDMKYRSSKKEIRETFKYLVEREVAVPVPCEQSVKMLFLQSRIKAKRAMPANYSQRKPLHVEIGKMCYLHDGSRHNVVNPCIPFAQSGCGDGYRVMFTTNSNDGWSTTSKLDINSYRFATVYPKEIGQTPEEAVRNSW